jgi:ATP-binding cassette subfamily B protein
MASSAEASPPLPLQSPKAPSNYWRLRPYVRRQMGTIARALGCTLGFTAFWPVLAWLPGQLAEPIGSGNLPEIARLAAIAAAAFVVRGAFQYGQDSLMAAASLQIAKDLRVRAYRHLLGLGLDYFETAASGEMAYRLTGDIDRIGDAIAKLFHQFVPCILQLIVVLGYMIYLNWQLTVASLIIAPLMAVLIAWFGDRLLGFSRRSQDRVAGLAALVAEAVSSMRPIQAFGAEAHETERFAIAADASRRAKYRAQQIKAVQFVVVGFLQAASVLFLFWLGGWQISKGHLTGGGFISYVAAVALLIDPIAITTSNYNEFKESEASVDRLFALLQAAPAVVNRPDAQPLPPITGQISYEHLTFSYPQGDRPVLEDLNLTIAPGETVALVGPSGAGKSTIVNLLLRFYEPQTGRICLDGFDLQTVAIASLRRQIGLVPQDTVLLSGTIAENIAFGRSQGDRAAIERAARIANAHEFISQLPQGYDTWVGERGASLSGGQRQRIAIARAVLLDPQILILDEATSALDAESEALVQDALDKLMGGRTTLAIAHRLTTVRRADRILVLEGGRILESGTHDQLLAQGGRYADYYARQFR